MGQCYKCKEFLGPDHLSVSENKKYLICNFCKEGKNKITYYDKDNKQHTVTKQECVGKYKEFMAKMVKAESIRKKILKGVVKGNK